MATTIRNPLCVRHVHTAPGALDFTTTRAVIVYDACAHVTTAAAVATSMQVFNAAAAISDDFSLGNNTAGQAGRPGTMNDANMAVAAGGTIRSTLTGAGTAAVCDTYLFPND